MIKKFVIIVAGGSGKRMGGVAPKQFMEINNKPILMYTIERFSVYERGIKIIVVLPRKHLELWKELCRENNFSIPHIVAEGGSTRFDSVKNGLNLITQSSGYVAIHDGVRPLVADETIERCFSTAIKHETAVPAVAPAESLRIVEKDNNYNVNRDTVRLIQTPQVFELNILRNAYRQPFNPAFTDDASVVEAAGKAITLTEGNRENIKITHPEDLLFATFLLQEKNNF